MSTNIYRNNSYAPVAQCDFPTESAVTEQFTSTALATQLLFSIFFTSRLVSSLAHFLSVIQGGKLTKAALTADFFFL